MPVDGIHNCPFFTFSSQLAFSVKLSSFNNIGLGIEWSRIRFPVWEKNLHTLPPPLPPVARNIICDFLIGWSYSNDRQTGTCYLLYISFGTVKGPKYKRGT